MKKHNKNIKNRFSSNPYHPVLLAPPCLPPASLTKKKKKKKKRRKKQQQQKARYKAVYKKIKMYIGSLLPK